ncbi:MAG: hypothetical protein NZ898_02005 [Myxococcota bacterium]|nr:hypothetical protein [Myxococcota bacterium]MDW8361583.1 hypothetical protein [Myxococcales bacterium]
MGPRHDSTRERAAGMMGAVGGARGIAWLLGLSLPGAVVLVTLASPTAAQSPVETPAACTVRGTVSVDEARVEVQGSAPLRLALREVRAEVVLEPGRPPRIAVLGPLRFEALPRTPLPWRFTRGADLAGGVLHVSPATRIARVEAGPDGVRADVELSPALIARAVAVPCGLLALGAVDAPTQREAVETGHLVPRRRTLALRPRPTEAPSVELELRQGARLGLQPVGRDGGFSRVWRTFENGSGLSGWVDDRDVVEARRPMPASPVAAAPVRRARCEPVEFDRPTLPEGTTVHVRPDGPVWATVAADAAFVLAPRPRGWSAILHAEGIAPAPLQRCPRPFATAFIRTASEPESSSR